MANDEGEANRRVVRGWRGRLEDAIAVARKRVAAAPAATVYHGAGLAPDPDRLAGHVRWFHLERGPEHRTAAAELASLRQAQRDRAASERSAEERERKREADRLRYKRLTPAQREQRQQRAAVRRSDPATRARDNQVLRAWRARQSPEWRAREAAMKRKRRNDNIGLYGAIDRRSKTKNRDQNNARRRASYRADSGSP